jgi:hypothetical protein
MIYYDASRINLLQSAARSELEQNDMALIIGQLDLMAG